MKNKNANILTFPGIFLSSLLISRWYHSHTLLIFLRIICIAHYICQLFTKQVKVYCVNLDFFRRPSSHLPQEGVSGRSDRTSLKRGLTRVPGLQWTHLLRVSLAISSGHDVRAGTRCKRSGSWVSKLWKVQLQGRKASDFWRFAKLLKKQDDMHMVQLQLVLGLLLGVLGEPWIVL